MNPLAAGAACALLALTALGCVTDSPTRTKAVWVRADGSRPGADEFRDAERRCEMRVNPTVVKHDPDVKAAAWAVRMVACMEEEGLFLVEAGGG